MTAAAPLPVESANGPPDESLRGGLYRSKASRRTLRIRLSDLFPVHRPEKSPFHRFQKSPNHRSTVTGSSGTEPSPAMDPARTRTAATHRPRTLPASSAAVAAAPGPSSSEPPRAQSPSCTRSGPTTARPVTISSTSPRTRRRAATVTSSGAMTRRFTPGLRSPASKRPFRRDKAPVRSSHRRSGP